MSAYKMPIGITFMWCFRITRNKLGFGLLRFKSHWYSKAFLFFSHCKSFGTIQMSSSWIGRFKPIVKNGFIHLESERDWFYYLSPCPHRIVLLTSMWTLIKWRMSWTGLVVAPSSANIDSLPTINSTKQKKNVFSTTETGGKIFGSINYVRQIPIEWDLFRQNAE